MSEESFTITYCHRSTTTTVANIRSLHSRESLISSYERGHSIVGVLKHYIVSPIHVKKSISCTSLKNFARASAVWGRTGNLRGFRCLDALFEVQDTEFIDLRDQLDW
jgi:hypothetical protein